jgi:hypothetical protein
MQKCYTEVEFCDCGFGRISCWSGVSSPVLRCEQKVIQPEVANEVYIKIMKLLSHTTIDRRKLGYLYALWT